MAFESRFGDCGVATRAGGVTARDLFLLAAFVALGPGASADAVARETGATPLEAMMALERARRVGLVDDEKKHLRADAFREFLSHGARFVFPAELGAPRRGPDGAWFVPVAPLDPLAPGAAERVPRLRELLELVDELRGRDERRRAKAARRLETFLKRRALTTATAPVTLLSSDGAVV